MSAAHRAAKVAIAWIATLVLVAWLVLPGWTAADREGLLPTWRQGVIGLMVPEAPGIGDVSINIQTGTRGSAGRTSISFYVSINSGEELKKPIRVVFGGPIAAAVRNCTGLSDQTQKDLRFSALDADAKILALRTLRADYNQQFPSTTEYRFVGETEILDAFEDVPFTEITLRTSASTVFKEGQEYPYRIMRSECSLDGGSLWEDNGGPQFRFRLPQLAIQTPQANAKSTPRVYDLGESMSVRMALGASYTVARYNTAPSEVKPDSISWTDFPSRGGDQNVSMTSSDSISAVLEDSDSARKENAAIYRSGIGLGIGGSLLAWTLPEIYDLAALGALALWVRRKTGSKAVPTQAEGSHSDPPTLERESGSGGLAERAGRPETTGDPPG